MARNNKKRNVPQWKRNALSGAIALALAGSGLYAAPAFSAACPGSITGSEVQCEAGGTATITITSTGEVLSTSPGDAAIYVEGTATGVTLDNSGSIIGGWAGIYVDADATDTTITNRLDGLISGSYTGIYYGGALDGTLTNAGTISVDDSIDWAAGVYVSGDLTGTLTNSGAISATAFDSTGTAYAYGVYVDNDLSGTLTNSGTISATATGTDTASYAIAYGVYVGNDLADTLTNTGSISAQAEAAYPSDAYAYGVYVGGNLAGTLTNSGDISATAYGGTATAYGIYVGGDLSGILTNTNSGTISATATGYSATAYGVYVGNDLTGTLTNSGTINVSATATSAGSNAYAYGIYVGGNLTGTLTNSGDINVTATSLNSDAYAATGIYISGDLSATGVLNNSGTITATAIAYSYAYDARGIYVGGELAGSLTNSGSISATAISTTGGYAIAYGVYVDNDLSGTLTNSGSISATATNTYSYATAYGVYVGGDLSGTLTNSGSISASANAYSWASAHGVEMSSLYGALTNSGSISATAISTNSSASAYGVEMSDLYGTLTNSGSISASAEAYSWAGAYGVEMSSLDGALTNSGSISASAASTGGGTYASAYGVAVWGDLDGALTNAGTISATASGDTWASAYGVYAGSVGATGVVTNTGTISASASASAVALTSKAAGFRSWTMNGTLDNSGRIFANVAGDPANAYSIYVNAGTGTINNQAGGVLGSLLGGVGGGTLWVGGTVAVNNAGTIAIPAGAVGDILGNYTQQSGGVLQIGATNNATYGSLVVGGIADLTGSNTIAVRATIGNTLGAGNVLQDVLSAGSWAGLGDGDTVNVIGTPLFTFTGVEDGTGNIDITIASANNFSGALGALGNSSLLGVAGALDALVGDYTGVEDMDPLLEALYGLNTLGEMGDAVQQLTPLMAGGMTQAMASVLRNSSDIIEARQDANLGLASGDMFYGDRKLWVKPFGSWADQDNRDGVPGYDADTYGFALGVDGEMSATTRIGAAFTYANSDVDASGAARQNADVDSYQATLYGSHSIDDRTHMNFQAGLGVHNTDGRRYITLPVPAVASSDYDSWSVHLGAGIARSHDIGPKTTFTPSLRADYTSIRDESYTETGAGPLNLDVDKNTTDALIFAVDGKFIHAVSDSTKLTANLGVGYDVLSEQASVTSSFVGGGPAFTTKGIDPSPWLVRGGLGLVMTNSNALEVTARYDIEAREDFTNQSASINIRLPF